MTPEEQAREKINRLIEAAGWTYREEALAGRRSGRGFSDYVLYAGGGLAVAVLEAKRAEVPSLSGKEQAREYADSIGVRHVFLSNGDLHYHWVTDSGNPVRIMALPTLDELDHFGQQEAVDRSPLWETPVDENFLRTRTMRPYQLAAVQAVQEYAEAGRHGFLLEMATGTGKTTVAAAICRLYLQAGVAERILFLVDRDELYLQAVGDLDQALGRPIPSGGVPRPRRGLDSAHHGCHPCRQSTLRQATGSRYRLSGSNSSSLTKLTAASAVPDTGTYLTRSTVTRWD